MMHKKPLKNIHSTVNMTPVDASNNPDKVKYIISTSTKIKPKGKPGSAQLIVGDSVRNADKRNVFSKEYIITGTENCLKLMNFSKHNHQQIR